MTALIILGILVLLAVVAVQIGKISEIASKLRGEEEADLVKNNSQAFWLVVFMVVFLALTIGSAYYYKDIMLGYGPMTSASEHGVWIDSLFNTTLIFTGIVFFVTQVLTFWYPYKYRRQEGSKAQFISHNNTLELVWTLIPAIVMAFLVVKGLVAWNKIMPDVEEGQGYVEVEATGYQFAWDLRLPGADNKLGASSNANIDLATNPLGMDWSDDKSMDDIVLGGADKLVLPVDTLIRVRIKARDVMHNFYLPQFRVKMDAVPGMPTYFKFTPTITTKEFRQRLSEYEEWQKPYDPADPDLGPRWKNFNYELACAELCGKGHYSMKRIVEIVSKEEFAAWKEKQQSYYLSNIRGTDADPRKGQLLDIEIANRATAFNAEMKDALAADDMTDRIIRLEHVFYTTGSAALDGKSKYELNNLVRVMKESPSIKVELRGHTDNVGDDAMNLSLSQNRSENVKNYLVNEGIDASRIVARGYGETKPVESNETPEGRQQNRRTELRFVAK